MIRSASNAGVARLLTRTAVKPEELLTLVGSASAPTRAQIIAATAAAAPLTLDTVTSENLDLLLAVARFAAQDPRYRDIDEMSYFGVQLARLKKQIAAEGMTPANKAALLQIYNGATQALQSFLATENKP